MITLQSAMLITLGLFLAGFAMFLFAPIYRRRAERLATDALRASMPLTEAEIRADKDRLRAEHAITIHQLEAKAEQSELAAARQMVEINRRDAVISALEGQVAEMRTSLDEHENARRVLEQTITDRLPRVEARLLQAKRQLDDRDREIAALTQSTYKYSSALDEAHQINRQQREELARMSSSVTTRSYRNRDAGGNSAADGDVALRAELQSLRAKSRDQASLIERLQAAAAAAPQEIFAHLAQPSEESRIEAEKEIGRLKSSLAEAEQALKSAAGKPEQISPAIEQRLKVQVALIDAHETEIARLKAELSAAHDRLSKEAAKHGADLLQAERASSEPVIASQRPPEPAKKPTLIDRISAPRIVVQEEPVANPDDAPSPGFLRSMMLGNGGVPTTSEQSNAAPAAANDDTKKLEAVDATEPEAPVSAASTAAPSRLRRGGLIERLSGANKPALPGE